ncbi:MAG: hypothetical protein KDD01_07010 [Phaeodactylibacter sp.]|nr:hypothetical protein [Phaeodactylibacter sp.]
MLLYVQLWKPKPEWNNLPCEQREEFLGMFSPGVRRMQGLNVELVGFAVCDETAPLDSAYRYLAVWKMPNMGHVHMLEKAVRDEGWGNYFDITNARGRMISVDEFAGDMVKI